MSDTSKAKMPAYDVRDPQRSAVEMIEYAQNASSESAKREVHALAAKHPALRAALDERGFTEKEQHRETQVKREEPGKGAATASVRENKEKQQGAEREKPAMPQKPKAPGIAREALTAVTRFVESEERQQERLRPPVSEAVEKYRAEYAARKAEFDREESDRVFVAKALGHSGKDIERREYMQGPTAAEINERNAAAAERADRENRLNDRAASAREKLQAERLARPRIEPNGEVLEKARGGEQAKGNAPRRIVAHGSGHRTEDLGKDFEEHVATFKAQNKDRPGLTFRETQREFHVVENGRVIHSVCDDRDPDQVHRDELEKLHAETAKMERAAAATAAASEGPKKTEAQQDLKRETAAILREGAAGSPAQKKAFEARLEAFVAKNHDSGKSREQLKSDFIVAERHTALSREPGYKEVAASVVRLRQEGRVQDAGAAMDAVVASTTKDDLAKLAGKGEPAEIDKAVEARVAKSPAAREQTSAPEKSSAVRTQSATKDHEQANEKGREQEVPAKEQAAPEKPQQGARDGRDTGQQSSKERVQAVEAQESAKLQASMEDVRRDLERDLTAEMTEEGRERNREIEAAERSAAEKNARAKQDAQREAEREAKRQAAEQQAAYEKWAAEKGPERDGPSHGGHSR